MEKFSYPYGNHLRLCMAILDAIVIQDGVESCGFESTTSSGPMLCNLHENQGTESVMACNSRKNVVIPSADTGNLVSRAA